MTISESFGRFQYFNFETIFFGKRKPFLKNWSTVFWLKPLRLKTYNFHSTLLCYKPMLRQIEWQLQNGPITKSGVWPVTTLFFGKFVPVLEPFKTTNDLNVHIHIFRKRWSLILRCFFPVSIHNKAVSWTRTVLSLIKEDDTIFFFVLFLSY